jgi:hypothetical protein
MEDTNAHIILSLNATSNKSLKLFLNVLLKKLSDSLLISKRKFDDLQSVINNKILPHCHSGFYNVLEF